MASLGPAFHLFIRLGVFQCCAESLLPWAITLPSRLKLPLLFQTIPVDPVPPLGLLAHHLTQGASLEVHFYKAVADFDPSALWLKTCLVRVPCPAASLLPPPALCCRFLWKLIHSSWGFSFCPALSCLTVQKSLSRPRVTTCTSPDHTRSSFLLALQCLFLVPPSLTSSPLPQQKKCLLAPSCSCNPVCQLHVSLPHCPVCFQITKKFTETHSSSLHSPNWTLTSCCHSPGLIC